MCLEKRNIFANRFLCNKNSSHTQTSHPKSPSPLRLFAVKNHVIARKPLRADAAIQKNSLSHRERAGVRGYGIELIRHLTPLTTAAMAFAKPSLVASPHGRGNLGSIISINVRKFRPLAITI